MDNPLAGMNYVFGIKPENQPGTNDNSIGGAGILLVKKHEKEILLLFRNDYEMENTWCIPGGGINPSEEALAAAIREVDEEAQIKQQDYVMPSTEPIYSNPVSDDFTFHTFMGEMNGDVSPVLNFEHSDWGWFPINNLPKPLHPGVTKMFNEIGTSFIK